MNFSIPPSSLKWLIEQLDRDFLRFSEEMDNVLDPMAGTGSAVIAAMRTGRNGYGIDLSEEFVRIANERVRQETAPLFPRLRSGGGKGRCGGCDIP